jgi:tagatose-6-phosphate ketose/aldose isomerase
MKTRELDTASPKLEFYPKGNLQVDALSELLNLQENEKVARGLRHTPSEIAQQPDSWAVTFELFQRNRARIMEFLARAGFGPAPSSAPIVFLVGAGTSDYIGQALTYLFRKRWHSEVLAVPSTDLLTHMDELVIAGRKYFWISFSRSGESPEGVAALERARKRYPDIHHLVVTCNAKGRMVRESANDPQVISICLDDAVNDRGLAMTSSFTNMVVFGQCLAHIHDIQQYKEILRQLVDAGKNFLPLAANAAASAAKDEFERACFVGSGALRAVARESALKLLELTAGNIVTMSESALGLRHGPMAALDKNTLFVCFLSSDQRTQGYEHDLLDEIDSKRLAKAAIVVGHGAAPGSDSGLGHYVAYDGLDAIPDDYRPPVDVMFGQLLGLFFSLRYDLQPDSPSPTGAISRVVQKFKIHE